MRNKLSLVPIAFLAVFLCTAIPPLTTSADEASSLYTFEQLLPMGEDEILSISDECVLAYEEAKVAYDSNVQCSGSSGPIGIAFRDENKYLTTNEDGHEFMDSDKMLADLQLPAEIVGGMDAMGSVVLDGDTYQEYILTLDDSGYNEYDMSDVYITTYVALTLNPEILNVRLEMAGIAPDGNDTTTKTTSETTTTTTSPLTTMSTTIAQSETTTADTTTANESNLQTTTTGSIGQATTISQTVASTVQRNFSSPKTGDTEVIVALGAAVLSLCGCILSKKH